MPSSRGKSTISAQFDKTKQIIKTTVFGAKHTRFSDDEETPPSAKRRKTDHEENDEISEDRTIKNDDKAEAATPSSADQGAQYAATRKSKTGSITDKLKQKFKGSESPEKTKSRTGRNTSQSPRAAESAKIGNTSPPNVDDQKGKEPPQDKEPEDSRDHDPKIIVSHAEVGKNYHKIYRYLRDDEKIERYNIFNWLKSHSELRVKYTWDIMPWHRMPHNCPRKIKNLGMPFLKALSKIWSRANYRQDKVWYWIDKTARTLYPGRPNARLGSEDIRYAAGLMRDADVRAETVTELMDALAVDHVTGFEEYEKKENSDETENQEKEKKAMFRRSAVF